MGQAYRFLGLLAALPLASVLMLSGCASTADSDGYYTVKRGDTLYSIGRDFDQSPANLRTWNRLRNPDDLEVGQRILVRPPLVWWPVPVPGRRRVSASSGADTTPRKNAGKPAAKPAPKAQDDDDARPGRCQAGLDVAHAGQVRAQRRQLQEGHRHRRHPGPDGGGCCSGQGHLCRSRHPRLRQHGDHQAHAAAAVGVCAQCDDHGQEGQMVTRGQQIATMGNSDTNKVKLYFEIRRNGKPVNVMALLPARWPTATRRPASIPSRIRNPHGQTGRHRAPAEDRRHLRHQRTDAADDPARLRCVSPGLGRRGGPGFNVAGVPFRVVVEGEFLISRVTVVRTTAEV
jgi:lipoprotein NlpD